MNCGDGSSSGSGLEFELELCVADTTFCNWMSGSDILNTVYLLDLRGEISCNLCIFHFSLVSVVSLISSI